MYREVLSTNPWLSSIAPPRRVDGETAIDALGKWEDSEKGDLLRRTVVRTGGEGGWSGESGERIALVGKGFVELTRCRNHIWQP